MVIDMDERSDDNSSSILQIKELKEKVRNLVSEVDLHRENAKFKPESAVDSSLNSSVCSDESEEEFIDCSELEFLDETNWLTEENTSNESIEEICRNVYVGVDDDRPDVTAICQHLEASSARGPNSVNIFGSQRASIDSRTFTRPKKFSGRPSLTSVVNAADDGRPKLQRRLTTTISPTPNLITKLEELSKTNNRPVSGNYSDLNWQDGSAEGLAEVGAAPARAKRRSVPASLFERLQELKKANSGYKVPKVAESGLANGGPQDYSRSAIMEEAKKVTAALDTDMSGDARSYPSNRLSEIFRNTQEYYSDDNESFINLDEVSGFCDRLTLSTDQSTYSSIVKEMEQNEICLFHRAFDEENSKNNRLTFGGLEIPSKDFPKNVTMDQSIEEENALNRTYEIDEEEPDVKKNGTFEIQKTEKHNIMNLTYDANKKPGLMDIILQSDVVKNLSPNNGYGRKSKINIGAGNNNNNNSNNSSSSNNNNINNNRTLASCEGNNILNSTYDKLNGTLDQNELNALNAEKYSTKVFDASFRKSSGGGTKRSPTRRSNGKSSDCSEDDCMSTTSDHSNRSVDSNSDVRAMEELRSIAMQQNKSKCSTIGTKEFSSTPIIEQKSELNFETVSPIRMEVGDGESHVLSNPSSRGQSPRRISGPGHQEGAQKLRMPNIREPLKVPQRELKLKPALVRPTANFKRPFSYSRTSSEPSVPQRVDGCQSAPSVPVLRPSGPTGSTGSTGPTGLTAVPSLTNVRPSSRASGIPRPPTRLKQPQIRVNYSRK